MGSFLLSHTVLLSITGCISTHQDITPSLTPLLHCSPHNVCARVCVPGRATLDGGNTIDTSTTIAPHSISSTITSSSTSTLPPRKQSLPHTPDLGAEKHEHPSSFDRHDDAGATVLDVDPYQPQTVADDPREYVVVPTSAVDAGGIFLESEPSPPPSPDPFSLNLNFANMTPIDLPPPKPRPRKSEFNQPDSSNLDLNSSFAGEDTLFTSEISFTNDSEELKGHNPFGDSELIENPFDDDEHYEVNGKLNPSLKSPTDNLSFQSHTTSQDSTLPNIVTFSSIAEEPLPAVPPRNPHMRTVNVHDSTNNVHLNHTNQLESDAFNAELKPKPSLPSGKDGSSKQRRSSVPTYVATESLISSANPDVYEMSRSSSQSGVHTYSSSQATNACPTNASASNIQLGLRASYGDVNDSPVSCRSGDGGVAVRGVVGGGIGVRSADMSRGGSVKEKRFSEPLEDEWEKKLCGRRSSEYLIITEHNILSHVNKTVFNLVV